MKLIYIYKTFSKLLTNETTKFSKVHLPPPVSNALKYRALQIISFALLFIAAVFLFNACNKDKDIIEPELSYRATSHTSTSEILSKINFDQNGNILLGLGASQVTLQHASIEYQREVSNYIFDNLSFSRIDSMKEMYGLPVWELATIDMSNINNNNYFVTIPLIQQGKFKGILLYQNKYGQKNIHLFDEIKINEVISYLPINSIYVQKWIIPVGKFNTYSTMINSTNNISIQNWLTTNRALLGSNSHLTYRDAEEICVTIYTELVVTSDGPSYICWDWCVKYGSGTGSGSEGGGFDGYFGDDDFGNKWNEGADFGNGSNAGGNGTYGDSGDNAPKVDKAKKLKCAIEVADFMSQAEVLQLIANNNLTDPCDPTKSAAELLEKALEGYCYAKSGDEPLNLKDAEHFMGEILEGGDFVNSDSELLYSELSSIECEEWKEPCWSKVLGEHKNQAKWFDDWCEKFKGFKFEYFQSRGWTGYFDSQGLFPDDEWRYVVDPTNQNYVIDMRHFLFVGFYLQQKTGIGNFAGDIIEFGQFIQGNQSGLNWQDYFSNRLGVSFNKWLVKTGKINEINTESFASFICEFLDSPLALNQRPMLNPQNCN